MSVVSRTDLSGSLVRVVREYMTQFRYGVQVPPAQRNMSLPSVEISTVTQETFVNAVMDPDVSFGEFRGIATVLDQWQRYSEYHALLVFELISLDISGTDKAPIVSTVAQLRTRYSRHTIENVFPHVAGNEPLIQFLIDKEIVYPCTNKFYFGEDGRIVRYDVEADFVQALANAIGDIQIVSLLLGEALIKQQHMIGELDESDNVRDVTDHAMNEAEEMGAVAKDNSPSDCRFSVDFLLNTTEDDDIAATASA